MSIEIRPVHADEMPAYRRMGAYVFAENDRDPSDSGEDAVRPEWTTCAFVDGHLAATMGALPFTMHWNGVPVSAAGITDVGTDPAFRRRGLLREIVEQGFREQRERGQYVAILWASMGAIYQRFGYGLASTHARYEFDPRQAALRDETPAGGTTRLVPAADALADMQRAYARYLGAESPRTLALERDDWVWRKVLRGWSKTERRHLAIYSDAAGTPAGYLSYGTKEIPTRFEPAPDQEMNVHDFVAVDVDAFRGLWAFIRAHDLVGRVHVRVAEDDPAPALMLEPRALRRRTVDGIWMRLVDVERALPLRGYSEAGALTLAVRDDRCDWNDGTFRLETDGKAAEVRRTDAAADLTLTVRALASLSAGHYSATQLARWGELGARDLAALRVADRLFATVHRPFCHDGF